MDKASRLLSGLEPSRERVFVDASGEIQPEPAGVPPGVAVVVAAAVTDALKEVSGGRIGSPVDRQGVLRASGFALGRPVLEALGVRPVDLTTLYEDVESLGYSWVVWVDTAT